MTGNKTFEISFWESFVPTICENCQMPRETKTSSSIPKMVGIIPDTDSILLILLYYLDIYWPEGRLNLDGVNANTKTVSSNKKKTSAGMTIE